MQKNNQNYCIAEYTVLYTGESLLLQPHFV